MDRDRSPFHRDGDCNGHPVDKARVKLPERKFFGSLAESAFLSAPNGVISLGMRNIIEKMEFVRLERDMTQEELESLSGLACGRISKWKDGKGEPSGRQSWKIAQVLGISAEWLLNDDARMEDWTRREGLLPIETHILHLANRLGHNAAAVILTDALPGGGGGKAAKIKPSDKPQGPVSTRPTPIVHEHEVTHPHDGRRRTRRRKPKGGSSSMG